MAQREDLLTIRVSDHITIRQFVVQDSLALFRLVDKNRERLGKRLNWVKYYTRVDDSVAFIEQAATVAEINGAPTLGIWYDAQLIGTVALHPIDLEIMTTHLGYWIDEDWEHKGIVSAAVRALINYGFNELELKRIEIVCSPTNEASQGIARKLGFEQDTRTHLHAIWSADPTAEMVVFAKTPD